GNLRTFCEILGMKSSFPTLEKKVPESKKYAHIASSIDTGASAKKEKLHSANVTAKRKDEIFKRVRPSTLVRLLQDREVSESVYAMGPGSERGDDASSVRASKEHRGVSMSVASVGSVAGSVVSVVETDTTVSEARDLVLLDVRDAAEFEQCHLPLAVSYPAPKINRDQFIPELLRCKREPKLLARRPRVVYGANEQATIGVARLLVEKGWDNVHALTGGVGPRWSAKLGLVLIRDRRMRTILGAGAKGSSKAASPRAGAAFELGGFEEMLQSYPEVLEGRKKSRSHGSGAAGDHQHREIAGGPAALRSSALGFGLGASG
ncbi:unnamed protein product, partial [Effrenium voratum]